MSLIIIYIFNHNIKLYFHPTLKYKSINYNNLKSEIADYNSKQQQTADFSKGP